MFSQKSDRIADAVRLLAAVGAVMADPTLLGTLRSGPAAYDALKKIAAAPPSSVGRLAETLAKEARRLFEATRELPDDAEIYYGQMVEIGLVTPAEIVGGRMNAAAVTEAMLAKLKLPEHRTAPMQTLFRELTTPTLARLLADKASRPTDAGLHAGGARRTGQTRHGITDVSAKLDDIAAQSRDTLEALALRFGEPEPEALALEAT